MNAILIFAMLALGSGAAMAAPAELRFQCPERYGSQPVELTEVPAGWQRTMVTVQPQLLVSGGGMVQGSPKLYPPMELRGSEGKMTKGGWRETRYPVEGESWVFCEYGQGGVIQLFRRVDEPGVHECVIRTRDKKPPESFTVEIVCGARH